MPRISEFQLVARLEQPVLSIQKVTKVENLSRLIGESYTKIAAYLTELGELMTDLPFVAYFNTDVQNLQVEIGFPIAKELPAKGDIAYSVIPGGKVVFCMYQGAYDKLGPVYTEMAQWMEKYGLQADGSSYEYYYNGPEYPEASLLTKVVMPLK